MMRPNKVVLLITCLILLFSLTYCQHFTGPDKDILIKIAARRIAFYGLKAKPEIFAPLIILARESCEQLTEQAQPAEVAFEIIAETIATKTGDPLLAQDLQDLIELIGIKLDNNYKISEATKDALKLITLFICAFAQGAGQ